MKSIISRICALAVFLTVAAGAMAMTKATADSCYLKGNYQQAIAGYTALLKQGVSPKIYYNLGNAYYRSDSLAKAILSYERALMLDPGNEDIRFNLEFANSKTIDKITPSDENIFVTWYHGLVDLASVDGWAKTAIASIIIALLLALAYLFASKLIFRKIGFFGGILFVAIFIVSTIFACQQKSALENRTGAIVMSPSVSVKQSPSAGSADAFVLHEGTRVDITDASIKGWQAIRVGDGRTGWIVVGAVEKI